MGSSILVKEFILLLVIYSRQSHASNCGCDTDCSKRGDCCAACPVGKYNAGCSKLVLDCQPCSNKNTGFYYSGAHSSANSCPSKSCLIGCPVGQYRKDCGTTAASSTSHQDSQGVCTACSFPSPLAVVTTWHPQLYIDSFSKTTAALATSYYFKPIEYQALDNGPGCTAARAIAKAEDCQTAAKALGYTGTVKTVAVNTNPKGCHVGTPADGWKELFFNTDTGKAGEANFRSICKVDSADKNPSQASTDACAYATCTDCATGEYRKDCGANKDGTADNVGACTKCTTKSASTTVYSLSPKSESCADPYVGLTTEAECKAAAKKMLLPFEATVDSKTIPLGCAFPDADANRTVSFNKATTTDFTSSSAAAYWSLCMGNTYFTGHGGQRDACPYSLCDTSCPVGQYRKDCKEASAGTCAACTKRPNGGVGHAYTADGGLTDTCAHAAVACPETKQTTPACSSCDSTGWVGSVTWSAATSAWDTSKCTAFCHGDGSKVTVENSGEVYCTVATAGNDKCDVVPLSTDWTCDSAVVQCKNDGSTNYEVTGACAEKQCTKGWPAALPEGYTVTAGKAGETCNGLYWEKAGPLLSISADQMTVSCTTAGTADVEQYNTVYSAPVHKWYDVLEMKVEVNKWKWHSTAASVGELWIGIVEAPSEYRNTGAWFWKGDDFAEGYAYVAETGQAMSSRVGGSTDFGAEHYSSGDVIGTKLTGEFDPDTGLGVKLQFTKNGADQGTAFNNVRGGIDDMGGYFRLAATMFCDASTKGNTLTIQTGSSNPLTASRCNSVVTCATNYHGTAQATCAEEGGYLGVTGCVGNTCAWPSSIPEGYTLLDATCSDRGASSLTVAACGSPRFVGCAASYSGTVTLACTSDKGTFAFSGCTANECKFNSKQVLAAGYVLSDATCGGSIAGADTKATVAECEAAKAVTCATTHHASNSVNSTVALSCPVNNGDFTLGQTIDPEISSVCQVNLCNFPATIPTGYTVHDNKCGGLTKTVEHCSKSTYVTCTTAYNGTAKLTCATTGGDFTFSGCTEADECEGDYGGHKCSGPNFVCINIVGGYICDCSDKGFRPDATGKCADANECATRADDASNAMTRSGPGVYCEHNTLLELEAFTTADSSLASAVVARDRCEAYCKANPACQACSADCPTGSPVCRWVAIPNCGKFKTFTGLINGDISRKGPYHTCHAQAKCTNTAGTFTCKCNDGYSGDGINNCVRTAGPVISLKGTNPAFVTPNNAYVDAGATCDTGQGSSGSITLDTSAVDTTAAGNYQVKFECADLAGSQFLKQKTPVLVKATRTVHVMVDNTKALALKLDAAYKGTSLLNAVSAPAKVDTKDATCAKRWAFAWQHSWHAWQLKLDFTFCSTLSKWEASHDTSFAEALSTVSGVHADLSLCASTSTSTLSTGSGSRLLVALSCDVQVSGTFPYYPPCAKAHVGCAGGSGDCSLCAV